MIFLLANITFLLCSELIPKPVKLLKSLLY
jgi:hypothetical protein